jgi:hypothetical protein
MVVSVPVAPCVPTVPSPGIVVLGMVAVLGPLEELDEPGSAAVVTSSGGGMQAPSTSAVRGSVKRAQRIMVANLGPARPNREKSSCASSGVAGLPGSPQER